MNFSKKPKNFSKEHMIFFLRDLRIFLKNSCKNGNVGSL